MLVVLCRFVLVVPKVFTQALKMSISHPNPSTHHRIMTMEEMFSTHLSPAATLLHPVATRRCFQFPETRLIQYDCGMCVCVCVSMSVYMRVFKEKNNNISHLCIHV